MNSSRKRMKTEPSPTAELSLESTGTVQLYKLIPGALWSHRYASRRIYPISPFIGWSYIKEAFQVDRRKDVCHVFCSFEENPGVGGTYRPSNIIATGESPCFLPTNIPVIHVFASDSKNFLRFAFYLPYGEAHPDPEPNPEPVPVNSIISLELVTGSGYKCDIELTMSRVFSSFCNGTTVKCAKDYQERDRFFHGLVDKDHPQWSQLFSEFLICKSGNGRLPTIQIKGLKATPIIPKGFEVTPQIVLTPFSLLDKENKRYSCHREILEGQWPFIRQKLEENPSLNEMNIEGGSATVGVILHHFYYPQQSLPPIKSFGEALDLLKVAHQLEIPKLLAHAVDTLRKKIDLAESTQLMELYLFLRQLKFKIQIFCKLWSALVIRMTDRIVKEGNRFDASDSILCVESFTEDGSFNLELLQELADYLEQPWKAEPNDEDKAKQISAQLTINRFKDVVLKRALSKLKTNNIQL